MIIVAKRIVLLLAVVWAAATLNFILPRLADRNPIEERIAQTVGQTGGAVSGIAEMVEAYKTRFGLQLPLWRQYLNAMADAGRLDLGTSIAYFPRRVQDIVLEALPWTIALVGTATLIAFVLGTVLGALTAWPGSPRWIAWTVPLSMVLAAIPFYLIGLVLVYVFAYALKWFPFGRGYGVVTIPSLSWSFLTELLRHALLPAMSIVLAATGTWALGMRALMVMVQGQDFMIFARAKGLSQRRIFWQYGVRNAIVPQLTTLVLALGSVVTGAVLVERVFGYPGIGSLLFDAVQLVDYFLIYGCVFLLILTIGVSLTMLDLAYPLLDPRIRASRS
ncbi:MAG: ABC transporter permease [Proteobacteria bacterium]|nr:ABC transporter permease [Pseudomonadota bacterium]